PHHARRLARVDEVVHHEHARAAAVAERTDLRVDLLEDHQLALVLIVVVARDADRLDEADLELTRHDRRRHQAAAGDADDGLEGPGAVQAPGECPRIAVELVPGDGKGFFGGGRHGSCLCVERQGVAWSRVTISATAARTVSRRAASRLRTTMLVLKRPSSEKG